MFKDQFSRISAFKHKFGAWDDKQQQKEWLIKEVQQSTFHKDYICKAVQDKDAQSWDVTTLNAALGTIMEPVRDSSKLLVKQARSKNKKTLMPIFEVTVGEKAQCSSWQGLRVDVQDPSTSDVVQCRVTKVEKRQVEIVSAKMANDKDLPMKMKENWKEQTGTETDVYLPMEKEVEVVVNLRNKRNALFHKSKPEMEEREFKEFMEQFRGVVHCPFLSDECLKKIEEATNCELFVSILKCGNINIMSYLNYSFGHRCTSHALGPNSKIVLHILAQLMLIAFYLEEKRKGIRRLIFTCVETTLLAYNRTHPTCVPLLQSFHACEHHRPPCIYLMNVF